MATTATWFAGLLGAILANGVPVETSGGLNFKAPFTVTPNVATGVLDIDVSLAGSPISQIQSEGVNVAQRTKLNFKGFTVTDDAGNDRTNVALTTSDPTSTGQIVTWSNALGKWVAGRTLTGSYSAIGDVSVTSFLAVGTTPPGSGAVRVDGDINATGFAALSGAGSYVAVGASPAASGQVRAGSAWSVVGKTAAAADQIVLSWGLSGADVIALGNFGGAVAKIEALATTQIDLYVNSALQARFTDTTVDLQNNNVVTTGYGSFGPSAPSSGTGLRVGGTIVVANATGIYGDSSPGGTPVLIAQVQADETLLIGTNGTNGTTLNYYDTKSTGSHVFATGGTTRVTVASTGAQTHDADAGATHVWKINGNTKLSLSGSTIQIGATGVGAPTSIQQFADTFVNVSINNVAQIQVTSNAVDFHHDTTANFALKGLGEAMIGLNIAGSGVRNIELFGDGSGGMGGMDGGMRVNNAVVVPTTNPTNAFLMYSEGGAGKGRGSSGTITTFVPAEPHCQRCSRDFALAWENTRYGKLEVCVWCMTDALERAGISRDEWSITKEAA